jgi:hypothetical protein
MLLLLLLQAGGPAQPVEDGSRRGRHAVIQAQVTNAAAQAQRQQPQQEPQPRQTQAQQQKQERQQGSLQARRR